MNTKLSVKMVVELLIGHCRLNSHMPSPCVVSLQGLRVVVIKNPTVHSSIKKMFSRILVLIQKAKLEGTFYDKGNHNRSEKISVKEARMAIPVQI